MRHTAPALWIASAAVMVLLGGCSVPNDAPSADHSSATPGISSSPTLQLDASPSIMPSIAPVRTDGPVGHFAGTWTAHVMRWYIDSSGAGQGIWRLYESCSDKPPPCDLDVENGYISGGFASFTLRATSPTTAEGSVLTTTVPSDVPLGKLTARLEPEADLLWLSAPMFKDYPLCGHRAAHGRCGA